MACYQYVSLWSMCTHIFFFAEHGELVIDSHYATCKKGPLGTVPGRLTFEGACTFEKGYHCNLYWYNYYYATFTCWVQYAA